MLIPFNASRHAPQAALQQGFSLLEILVAFVIMGLVVGTLLQLFGSAMNNLAISNEYSQAVQIAESRLQSVGKDIPVEEGGASGSEQGSSYQWAVQIAPVELLEEPESFGLPVQPYQVTVTVKWDSNGKPRDYVLSSLRFGEPP